MSKQDEVTRAVMSQVADHPQISFVTDVPTLKEVASFTRQRGLYTAEESQFNEYELNGSFRLPRPLPELIMFIRHPSRGDILVSLALHVMHPIDGCRTAVLELHVAQYCDDWQELLLKIEPAGRDIAKALGCKRIEIPGKILRTMGIRRSFAEFGYRFTNDRRKRLIWSALEQAD